MEDIKMKGFKNSVEQLFDKADCSTEYKALLAEQLAYKWRMISDTKINEQLKTIAEKGEKEDGTSQIGKPAELDKQHSSCNK